MSFLPELTESDNATALFSHSLVVDCHVNVGGHIIESAAGLGQRQ